ncbi:MAG: hypothetical protein Q9224_007324, partial [Gallowayella concinna]
MDVDWVKEILSSAEDSESRLAQWGIGPTTLDLFGTDPSLASDGKRMRRTKYKRPAAPVAKVIEVESCGTLAGGDEGVESIEGVQWSNAGGTSSVGSGIEEEGGEDDCEESNAEDDASGMSEEQFIRKLIRLQKINGKTQKVATHVPREARPREPFGSTSESESELQMDDASKSKGKPKARPHAKSQAKAPLKVESEAETLHLTDSDTPQFGTHGKPLHKPTKLTGALKAKCYQTLAYKPWTPHSPTDTIAAATKFRNTFSGYANYYLFQDPDLVAETLHSIPTHAVRIDDSTAGLVLLHITSPTTLHRNWPAEFDTRGMIKATRAPLGNAYKLLIKEGDKDLYGRIASKKDEGYYY